MVFGVFSVGPFPALCVCVVMRFVRFLRESVLVGRCEYAIANSTLGK